MLLKLIDSPVCRVVLGAGAVILAVIVLVGITLSHQPKTIPGGGASAEEVNRYMADMNRFMADPELVTKYGHPGLSAPAADQVPVTVPLSLPTSADPAYWVGVDDTDLNADVRIFMSEGEYRQFLQRASLPIDTDPSRLLLSEASAQGLVPLQEVYAQMLAQTAGTNPVGVLYEIIVE